jgi:hypothetical protein
VVSEVTITGVGVSEFQAVDASTGLSKEDVFRMQIANDLGVDEVDVIISKITVTNSHRRRLTAASVLEVAFIIVQTAAENVAEIQQRVAELELAVEGASVSVPGVSTVEAARASSEVEARLAAAREEAITTKAALLEAQHNYKVARVEALLLTPGVAKILSPGE